MMPRHKPECRAKTMVSCLHDQGHIEELYNRNTAVLLYPLKYWSLCNQTSLMVHHYKPEKNWLLSSRSRSQQGLKSSLNVCQSYIFCPIALQSNCMFWLLITTSSADNVGMLILTITLTYSITRNTTGEYVFCKATERVLLILCGASEFLMMPTLRNTTYHRKCGKQVDVLFTSK